MFYGNDFETMGIALNTDTYFKFFINEKNKTVLIGTHHLNIRWPISALHEKQVNIPTTRPALIRLLWHQLLASGTHSPTSLKNPKAG